MWPASNSSAGRTSTSTTSPRAQPLEQLVAADRLDVVAEVVARGALDLGQPRGRRVAQREPQPQRLVAGERVAHAACPRARA